MIIREPDPEEMTPDREDLPAFQANEITGSNKNDRIMISGDRSDGFISFDFCEVVLNCPVTKRLASPDI
jgi:hypothetical protein